MRSEITTAVVLLMAVFAPGVYGTAYAVKMLTGPLSGKVGSCNRCCARKREGAHLHTHSAYSIRSAALCLLLGRDSGNL